MAHDDLTFFSRKFANLLYCGCAGGLFPEYGFCRKRRKIAFAFGQFYAAPKN